MSSVTDRDAGMASGIQDVSKDLGGAIGIALFGSIFTIRYTDFFGASTSSATAQGIHDSIASSFTAHNWQPSSIRTTPRRYSKPLSKPS